MSFAQRHNKGGIDWKIDDLKTDSFQFWKREECFKEDPEKIYRLRGIYINKKGKFGDHPVAILDDRFMDLPDYLTEEVKSILTSQEDVEDIIAGKVGIKLEAFTDKNFGKECIGVKWIDLEA